MSQPYQVLARKYRSKNFHELVGQTHVSKALINAIDHNRLHHAYLFTGTRGIGKTTIARILSKCLNCETGVTSTPCGVCGTCVAIDDGRFIDLIEIDAASRTKVEDTRELIDNVPYAPTQGRFKVYLIDEVHMLSTHSFNALLKTLEEPPAHVKFLLATTDPQKLPITIISRCLQFVLRPLPQQAISEHLAYILTNEGVNYTESALWQLANAAKGSMRDALSLTDQAIAFGQGSLTDDTVNDMLGLIDSADLISLLKDIYEGNAQALSAHIEQMRLQVVDAGSMFDGLAELLHQLAMTQLLPDMALNANESQASQIKQLASQISADVLQLYYQIVIQGREQIKLANTPLQALEMCLLRLLAFRPLNNNEVLAYAELNRDDTPASSPNATPDAVSFDDPQAIEAPSASNPDASEHKSANVSAKESVREHIEEYAATDTATPSRPATLANNAESINDATNHEKTRQQVNQSLNHNNLEQSHLNAPQNNDEQIKTATHHISMEQAEVLTPHNSATVVTTPADERAIRDEAELPSEPLSEDTHQTTAISNDDLNHTRTYTQELSQPAQLSDDDPRKMLYCPAVELEGEWTPEKWDYWLQSARQSGQLAQDELALARQGVMVGEIHGSSTFKVIFDTKNMKSIFNHLASHLAKQFGADVTIEIDSSLADKNRQCLPQTRQKIRLESAKNKAHELLSHSPVMQELSKFDAHITNLKFL